MRSRRYRFFTLLLLAISCHKQPTVSFKRDVQPELTRSRATAEVLAQWIAEGAKDN